MVTRDYKCPGCGAIVLDVRMPDTEIPQCVLCLCALERIPSAPAFKVTGGTPKFHK